METRDINSIQANPKNPRNISEFDYGNLVNSIRRFGDLSGVVENVRTGHLVGGHQRIQVFKQLGAQPVIQQRFETPNSVGTIARGYILLGDEQYTFRQVDWDEKFESAAMIAANRIQGEWNLELLAEIDYDLASTDPDLLKLTGQKDDELEQLLSSSGAIEGEKEPKEPSMTLRVECGTQEELTALYQELIARGLKVRI